MLRLYDVALEIDAGRAHRFIRRHTVVEHVDQDLQDRRHDLGSTRRSHAHAQLVLVEDHGRGHHRHSRLAWSHGVGAPGPRVEAVHVVVVGEAETGGDDAAGRAKSVRQRDGVAGVVDHANVRGIRAVSDHLARLRRVVLVRQRAGRDVDKARVGDVQLAVGDRPSHRFDQQARRFRARPAVCREVEALEEVEHLQQSQAPGRRARGHHLQAAIRAADRLGHVDRVALQVSFGDEPPVGCKVGRDGVPDLALVEDVGAFAGQPLECSREISLDQQISDGEELAIARVDRLRRRRDLDPLGVGYDIRPVVHRPVAVDEAWHRESVASQGDRRLYGLLPRDRAKPRECLVQPGHRAGHGDRLIAHVVDPAIEHVAVAVGGLAEEDRLPLVLAGTRAGRAVELEQRVAALRRVDEHRAAPADAAHLRIDDALHESACDGGINRVAATPHDLETDLRRLGLRADDDGHGGKLVQISAR